MAFVYPVVAIAGGILGPNRLWRALNVQRESCLADEDEFFQRVWVLSSAYLYGSKEVDFQFKT